MRIACGVSGTTLEIRGALTPLANCRSAKARRTTRTCCTPPLNSLASSSGLWLDFDTQGWTGHTQSMRQNISDWNCFLELFQAVRDLAACWLGWMFHGYETYALVLTMAPAVHQILPEVAKAPIYMGGLLSATLLGWACGGIAAGVLADYLGRRRTLMLSIFWYALFAGLTALSQTYSSFLVFRFFTGFGLGAEWGPGAAIVAELWPPVSRGRAAGVLHSAHGVGIFLAAGIWLLLSPLGPSAWRYMFVVGVLPAFLLLYVRRGSWNQLCG